MIRRALALALAAAAPAAAAPEGGPIRGGEHAGFTRLVMQVDPTTEWSLETGDGPRDDPLPRQAAHLLDRRGLRPHPARAGSGRSP